MFYDELLSKVEYNVATVTYVWQMDWIFGLWWTNWCCVHRFWDRLL